MTQDYDIIERIAERHFAAIWLASKTPGMTVRLARRFLESWDERYLAAGLPLPALLVPA